MMQSVRPQRARTPAPRPFRGPTVSFFQDRRGEWRWRVKSRNGRIVADSAESYTRKLSAERGFKVAQAAFAIAVEPAS